MYIYITNGTFDFLHTLKKGHDHETMILIGMDDEAILLHETSGESVFVIPQGYELIDSVGSYEHAAFAVMNHIPVPDEDRPLFEYRFKNRDRIIEKQSGFVGVRVLRPLASDTYIILTLWESEADFEGWKQSEAFGKSHKKSPVGNGEAPPKKMFSGASYVKKYLIPEEQ